ncbi:hypothetical protein GKD46_05345 [Parabacteroides distasonis]|nr:hypothetical protein [Parabacteroides distasonis]MRZ09870.1 hypothetical protein [Parabacteroides distasonis]
MKVNENTIYIFLLGILAGIICMQCVNHFRKSPKDVYVDNFEYEKESLGILKREVNPAKRNVMVVKNEMRLLKQKRNVLQI